jgi:Na+/H+-dicarboxylate symporter
MGVYVGTVLFGLLLVLLVYLSVILMVTRQSFARSLRGMREVLLLAFSTSSSAAVMPLSIKTAEEKFGVRPSISQLVVPLGATMNMNGTALYQGVATMFLAQIFGIDIGFSGLLLVVLIAVGASIGSPGTPGVGIIILSVVLGSIGIPAAAVVLIMGVDRILDMSRTAINVAGDLTACVLMDRWVGGKRSASEQLAEESAREWQRTATGRDALLRPTPPRTVKGSDYI